MKRIKSILTVLMAAVFALSLVPAGAWAAMAEEPTDDPINAHDTQVQGADPTTIANHNTNGQTGVLGTQHGTMTIANAKANETYKVYRLFELASFDDEDSSTGVHGTNDQDEAYSYVIDLAKENGAYTNKWATFLTTQGPAAGTPYAALSNAETGEGTDGIYTLEEAAQAGYYFVIDAEAVTVNGTDTYHVITPTSLFSHAGASGNRDDMGDATDRSDDGVSAGDDYVDANNSNKVVQDFAQQALKYAEANTITPVKAVAAGSEGGSTPLLEASDNAPLGYYLVGTSMGTLAALDTTNTDVTVYEKNDEPTVEKAILKKGEGFDAADADDLVGNSMALKAKRIADLRAEKADLQAQLSTLQGDPHDEAEERIAAIDLEIERLEDDEPAWVKNTDCDLEDYVAFRTVITAQQGARDYRLHDVMEVGLELVEATVADDFEADRHDSLTPGAPKVYLVRGESDDAVIHEIDASKSGYVKSGYVNYVLKTGSDIDPSDGCDFEIWFKDATVDGSGVDNDNKVVFYDSEGTAVDVKDGDKIVVVYWAKVLKDDAVLWCTDRPGRSKSGVRDNSNGNISPRVNRDFNGNGRNDNYTVLTYGNKSHTQWDKASATVYEFDIAKTDAYDVDDTETVKNKLLQGAKFKVYKATTGNDSEIVDPITVQKTVGGNTVTYTQESGALLFDETDKPTYTYEGDVATADDADGTMLESDKDGAIRLKGLEAGDYILVEEEAPAGYNKLANPIVVTVTGDVDSDGEKSYFDEEGPEDNEGRLTYRFTANDGSESTSENIEPKAVVANSVYTVTNGGGVHIVNQTGQELPSTGGIGTTIFYVAGTVLVVGAAVMLVAKRRMGAEG